MRPSEAEIFFAGLGRDLKRPVVIALTGGIAAGLLADPRVTDDIDFAILRAIQADEDLEKELQQAARRHKVVLQYSRDIDRWSSVTFLDWKKHSQPWKKFGKLEVRILDPYYWSIGKIARGTEWDLRDLEMVFKAQKMDWKKAAKLWARALRKSPPSSALFNARQRMERFFGSSGKKIWGAKFDPVAAREFLLAELERLRKRG